MEPTPIVWQVEYKHFGFVYWWDYPSADIISVLEACHANKADMDFTWTWPMGRVATYRTRIAAGIVVNTLTEHERKLRRLHVHVGDDVAMSDDQEVDPSACQVKWQVAYVIKGIDYWYDIEFSDLIETAFGAGRSSLDRRDLDMAEDHTSDWLVISEDHTTDWRRKHGWRDDAYVDIKKRWLVCLSSGHANKIRRVHITFCA